MQCPSCQHDNAAPARFCEACGAQLARSCAACGHEASLSARFCGECGASLGEAAPRPGEPARTPAAPAPLAPIAAPDAERRQLTVLFCDLVGSTPLSQRLDPEELREVMRLYEAAASEVIDRFDGHVAQHLGDGILAYFGWPRAHEDDAVRAVSAAIALVGELPSLNQRVRECMPGTAGLELQVRAGIHTGLVVVEDVGRGGRAVGETPNVAARLQALAEPNQVLISGATRRLVTGSVVLEDLGVQRLKGLAEPLSVYRALRWSGVYSRLELSAAAGLTPLVGRQEEVGILLNRWEQIQDGAGQVILIAGDAGMGKSRLLQVLRERLVDEPHSWLECRCSPYHESSAFHPIVGLLERGLLFASEDSRDDKLAKLERALGLAGFEPGRVVPLFAALLSLPLPERYPAPMLSPEAQRRKTLEALAAWFLALAALQPLVMVVEDLHWIDPSTLEFLGMLVEQVPTVPVLLVCTFRPSFQPPWSQRSHVSQLTLGRLTRRQAAAMIPSLAGGKQLPGEVLEQLVTKTDGVPLFVEELTKMVLESDLLGEREDRFVLRGPLGSLAIPSTLQDSLMTRLDRLGRAKEVAHLAATLGREFPYELIAALHLRGEGELREALEELVRAELLYQRGAPPEATYTFKHALIQELAYQSLLRSTRQQYHRSIVSAYEERFPGKVEGQPELLAHHCAEAGMPAQAIAYGRRAAERAAARSANLEAIQQFTRALELLERLAAGSERDRLELELRVGLAVPLQLLRGYSSPEVEGVYARARELCEALGDTPQILPVLHGLWRFYLVRGDLRAARQLSLSLLRMAEASGDPDDRLLAEWAEGATCFWMGETSAARAHLEASIALYDPARHGALALTYGSDPRVSCLVWLSIALCMLGEMDRGGACIEEAVRLARESEHPFSLAWAIVFKAANHQFRGEAPQALADAEEGTRIATEQAFPLWYGVGVLLRGWARVALGHTDVELEPLQQAMATLAGTGQELAGTYFMQVLADIYESKGKPAEALQVLGLGAALVKKNGEALFEGELVRRRGELLRREPAPPERGARAEAETCFRDALEAARRQGTRTLELRAATSLARLWNDAGRRKEARELLAPLHAAFSEGLETRDLREAMALLRELGP